MQPGNRPKGEPLFGGELFDLSDATYALLRDLIVQRTGVWFDPPKRGLLADKLSDLVAANGLTSFLDYYYLLRYDDEAADANWSALLNRLAVPETFFWRQSEQIEAAASTIIPALLGQGRRNGGRLRIWSAACCTGEEPLSVAIALAEQGLLDDRRIEIIASDASPALVARARRASYGERSFRQLPPGLRAKYFEPDGPDAWRPIERISRAVTFHVANLVELGDVAPLATADVIFCRNVFIYFSDDAIRRTARTFVERMPDDGYVFLGASESLTRLGVELDLVEVAGAFAYIKHPHRKALERERRERSERGETRAAELSRVAP